MSHFRPGQAGLAQGLIGDAQQPGGIKDSRRCPQPIPDRRRGLVADLLGNRRLQQAGRTRRWGAPGKRPTRSSMPARSRSRLSVVPGGAGLGWRRGELHPRVLSEAQASQRQGGSPLPDPERRAPLPQSTRFICPECGSMVNRATTDPSAVAKAKPMAPSCAGPTFTTFQVWLPCHSRNASAIFCTSGGVS